MTYYSLVLLTLAVYRLAYMITLENGPFMLFAQIRERIGERFTYDSWLTLGINCPLCVSFWLSAAAFLFGGGMLEWFGVAGAIVVLHTVIHRR
jgi:hypothetical protein